MKITVLTVGKTSIDYLQKGIDLYVTRLKPYIDVELKIIPEPKDVRHLSPAQQAIAEGKLILKHLTVSADTILLDELGQQPTSTELAALIERKMVQGLRELTFIIGGPYGVSDEVKKNVRSTIALSRLTFTHQIVRLIFFEQLYRAMTIIRGEPYHH